MGITEEEWYRTLTEHGFNCSQAGRHGTCASSSQANVGIDGAFNQKRSDQPCDITHKGLDH